MVRAGDTVRGGGVVRGLRSGAAPDVGEGARRRGREAAHAQREAVLVSKIGHAGAGILVVHGIAAAAAPGRPVLRCRAPSLRPPSPDAWVPPIPGRPRGRDHDVSDKSFVGRNEYV